MSGECDQCGEHCLECRCIHKEIQNTRQDLYSSLAKEYANLYGKYCFFECGPGWYYILRELSQKITYHLKERVDRGRDQETDEPLVCQVKEKYGGLRYYVNSTFDEVYDMIAAAERESLRTCEECGESGKQYSRNRWVILRCKECWEKE